MRLFRNMTRLDCGATDPTKCCHNNFDKKQKTNEVDAAKFRSEMKSKS